MVSLLFYTRCNSELWQLSSKMQNAQRQTLLSYSISSQEKHKTLSLLCLFSGQRSFYQVTKVICIRGNSIFSTAEHKYFMDRRWTLVLFSPSQTRKLCRSLQCNAGFMTSFMALRSRWCRSGALFTF